MGGALGLLPFTVEQIALVPLVAACLEMVLLRLPMVHEQELCGLLASLTNLFALASLSKEDGVCSMYPLNDRSKQQMILFIVFKRYFPISKKNTKEQEVSLRNTVLLTIDVTWRRVSGRGWLTHWKASV